MMVLGLCSPYDTFPQKFVAGNRTLTAVVEGLPLVAFHVMSCLMCDRIINNYMRDWLNMFIVIVQWRPHISQ
jgi:hypothetical protein